MIQEGQIVLFTFPQTDRTSGKLRPALVLRRCHGTHDDCLICMISSQLRHGIAGLDDIVRTTDNDFAQTGLKLTSVIRATRLAIVAELAAVRRCVNRDCPHGTADWIARTARNLGLESTLRPRERPRTSQQSPRIPHFAQFWRLSPFPPDAAGRTVRVLNCASGMG